MASVLSIHKQAFDDILYFSKNDLKIVKKIFELIEDIQKTPFEGIGKPEPLKHDLKGRWSRRISDEHRLVYEVKETTILIISCRYHY